jgi:hypothetical protein
MKYGLVVMTLKLISNSPLYPNWKELTSYMAELKWLWLYSLIVRVLCTMNNALQDWTIIASLYK